MLIRVRSYAPMRVLRGVFLSSASHFSLQNWSVYMLLEGAASMLMCDLDSLSLIRLSDLLKEATIRTLLAA